jgi:hypothetical protein
MHRRRLDSFDRGDVDDDSSRSLRDHLPRGGRGEPMNGNDVRFQDGTEVGVGDIEQRRQRLNAGIVDQTINATERRQRRLDDLRRSLLRIEVDFDRGRFGFDCEHR